MGVSTIAAEQELPLGIYTSSPREPPSAPYPWIPFCARRSQPNAGPRAAGTSNASQPVCPASACRGSRARRSSCFRRSRPPSPARPGVGSSPFSPGLKVFASSSSGNRLAGRSFRGGSFRSRGFFLLGFFSGSRGLRSGGSFSGRRFSSGFFGLHFFVHHDR